MKIVKKGFMPDTTPIRIEDWSETYSFYKPASTLTAYPKAESNLPGTWSPKRGNSFRLEMQFDSKKSAERAFDDLISGRTTLADYTAYMRHPEYAKCL